MIHNVLFYNREPPSRTPEKRLDCHRITLCTIAAQTPPTRYSVSNFSIKTIAGKNHKKPHHPSKVQSMNCFTANACGRRLPLLFITLQGYTSFRHLPLHSVHCPPPASAIHARVLPSFHFAHASPPFHSAPLWLPFPQPVTQSQNGQLHSTPPNSLLSIQSPPLLFPMPTSGMPCGRVYPGKQKPQKPHRPLMVQVKIKDHSRKAMCLQPDRLTHSTVRFDARSSRRRSLFHFVHRPASAPHVCVFRASTPTLFPPATALLPFIFTCGLFTP